MDAKGFSEKPSKIVGTTKVSAPSISYKDPEYALHLHSDKYATDTGLVTIAKLVSNDAQLPEFVFRWDDGKSEVDVDIVLNGKSRKDWGELGYKGHHTVLVNVDGREYEADIWMPERHIFKGVIKVGLIHGRTLSDNVAMSEHVDIKIVD